MADLPSRFLRLERPRKEAAPSPEKGARERFGAVELGRELEANPSPVPASAAERFRSAEGSGLALDPAPEGEQPFLRCAACEADNARHQARCDHCGADLTTAEQRAYNERLWAARKRESQEEQRACAALGEARRKAEAETASAKRALGELLAEEILERERARQGGHLALRLLARIGQFLSRRV